MYCVETNNLSHRYPNGDLVLDRVGLQVPEGSIYGFLGPNGAGKTTTLRLILGLLRKQQGLISVFGQGFDAHRLQALKKIGSLIENPSLYDHLTAVENLALLRRVYRLPSSRIGEVLGMVGLSDSGGKKIAQFSLGMKQRLSLAVSLLHRPSLLILDEPTNGLDPQGIVEMRDLLTRLNREDGITVLVSSHLLSEIERWVSHIGIIHRGRIRFQGSLDALRQQHRPAIGTTLKTNDDMRALQLISETLDGARIAGAAIRMPAMSDQGRARINQRLVESGIAVHELVAEQADLESIFMGLVRS